MKLLLYNQKKKQKQKKKKSELFTPTSVKKKTIFKYIMAIFFFMWHRSAIWMTLKQLKGNSLDYVLLILSDSFW